MSGLFMLDVLAQHWMQRRGARPAVKIESVSIEPAGPNEKAGAFALITWSEANVIFYNETEPRDHGNTERVSLAELVSMPYPVDHGPLKEMIAYCATAPAIPCGEGYWDDMESACGDGMRQAQSEAAALMRSVLQNLGIEAPAGMETCPDCFAYADGPGRGIDHSSQCQADQGDDEEEEEEGEENEASDVAVGGPIQIIQMRSGISRQEVEQWLNRQGFTELFQESEHGDNGPGSRLYFCRPGAPRNQHGFPTEFLMANRDGTGWIVDASPILNKDI